MQKTSKSLENCALTLCLLADLMCRHDSPKHVQGLHLQVNNIGVVQGTLTELGMEAICAEGKTEGRRKKGGKGDDYTQ